MMTHGDGVPSLSARRAWRGDAGHRKPCAPSQSHGPSESLGKPPFRSRRRTGSGRIGAGVEKPCRCPAGPAASLLPARWPARRPARWPDGSPARSLRVIINETWYNQDLAKQDVAGSSPAGRASPLDAANAARGRSVRLPLAERRPRTPPGA